MFRLLALLSVLVLLLTACPAEDTPEEEPPPPTKEDPVPPEDDEPADDEVTWTSCTNPEAGYTVGYPEDWHTNTANGLDACQVFDPEPIDLPDLPRDLDLDYGIVIRAEPIDFAELTAEDFTVEIVSEEDLEIDGHPAVRQELLATGEGLLPEGTEYTSYAIDRNGETIVAESFDVGEPAYERKVEVLDEMMATMQLD